MAYELLSQPIRKFIRDKGWESLRPIQAAAISKILTTENNYILASRTASGKTEAAFLPILSKTNFNEPGVQVLYISPLIALINDQFGRVEDLCKNLEIDVTKWHGEAKRSLKKKLLENPNGIVLITPESIEAMFINAPFNVAKLFSNLKFIVIDEIHSFIGTDRGLQLMSLIFRIREETKNEIVIIGLSATIGDENYLEAKKITGSIEKTKVLLDRTQKATVASFKFFKSETKELPLELLKDLYVETKNNKTLIFPNSRAKTEEIAVKLRRISDRLKGHKNYFSHHSSIDKEIRESVEHFAKNNERFDFCISCTSTLELGIDIGTVDKIIQIDSTHSVSSLVQRIGRSGRREGETSIVGIYATGNWNLLQALACWQLYKKGFLEPIKTAAKPYDILLHQLLSIVKQTSGIETGGLLSILKANPTFQLIDEKEIKFLIEHSIEEDYLEKIQNEIILGLEGEKIVNSREFYSVFITEPDFKVVHSGRKIGQIPFSPQIKLDENLLLAARIWKIKDIDFKGCVIEVIPAKDGKTPMFFGNGGSIHQEIRKEMLRIIKSEEKYEELNEDCISELEQLRFEFQGYPISDFDLDRPLVIKENQIIWFTFSGTVINRSLKMLIEMSGYEAIQNEMNSSLEINVSEISASFLTVIQANYNRLDSHLEYLLSKNDTLLSFSKWGTYLPVQYQIEILKERFFDFEGAINIIGNVNFRFSNS